MKNKISLNIENQVRHPLFYLPTVSTTTSQLYVYCKFTCSASTKQFLEVTVCQSVSSWPGLAIATTKQALYCRRLWQHCVIPHKYKFDRWIQIFQVICCC